MEVQVFVARERELGQLGDFLSRALAGQGQVCFVTGEAGSGKTTLVTEFARRAQDQHEKLIVAVGQADAETGAGDPYLPFREVLGQLTGDVEAKLGQGAITQENANRLRRILALSGESLVECGADLIGVFVPGAALALRAGMFVAGKAGWLEKLERLAGPPQGCVMPSGRDIEQSHIFEQYANVLAALAAKQPLLLLLDDLQWTDGASLGLLFHLGRRLGDRRILIVGTYRPEEVALGRAGERHPLEKVLAEFKRYFGHIAIDLDLTQEAEGRRFVDALLDVEPNQLGTAFRTAIYRHTEGHPLFTVELLQHMQERGNLVRDEGGRWVEDRSLNWGLLPTRVEGVIEERIGRLDEELREVLTVASVAGEDFIAQVVARVQAMSERELVRRLTRELDRQHRLVQEQAIVRVGEQRLSLYRFRHNLFQSYLYSDLGPTERELLHEEVGNVLEALYGEQADEIAVQLAWHFERAWVREKAGYYLQRAGEQARQRYAYEEAVAYLRRALELLKTIPETPERARRELDLQIALGVPLVHAKGHAAPEVEVAYARAQELCEQVGDASQRFQVLLGLRRFYFSRGELQTASLLGEQLLDAAQSLQDPMYVSRAHMMHGENLYWLGEFAQAREHCEAGVTLHDPQQRGSHLFLYGNDTGVGCRLIGALALWHLGYPDQALAMSQETLDQARALSHPFTLVFARYFHGVLHQLRWEVRAVQEQVQGVLCVSAERGFALYLAWGTILRGWALAHGALEPVEGRSVLGEAQVEEGIGQMCEGIAASQAIGAAVTMPSSLASLAQAYGQVGEIGKALDLLDEALGLVDKNGERCWEAELHRLKGELMLRKEEQAGAEACFQLALDVARHQRARSWELRAATSLSRLWHRQDRRAKARALLQDIYGWFSEGFGTADLVEARALLDALA
jgi:predicted ATPase